MLAPDIRSYLATIGLLPNAKISLLGTGESNVTYLAQEGKQSYIVRQNRVDVPGDSRFAREHHFMSFIEAAGIDFAPRSVYYDPAQDIHITTYVAGTDASIVDLTSIQTATFVRQLKRLNAISHSSYIAWCKRQQIPPYTPTTVETRNKINIDGRIHAIRESHTDRAFARQVLDWAEPKVAILYEAQAIANLQTIFLHDDLRWNEGGGNLKILGDSVQFIDWELSGFYETVPEIGDVLGSIPTTRSGTAVLRKLYETYVSGEANPATYNDQMRYGIVWGKLGNPLWAAERYLLLRAKNHAETQRYRDLAELGMKDADLFFSLPFEQWF